MRQIPYDRPTPRPPRSLIVALVVLVVLLIAALQSVSLYVESLWFGSLGFESVYWYGYKVRFYVFVAFFLATTLFLWLLFRLVIPASRGSRRPLFELNGQMIYLPGLDFVRKLAWPVAVLLGVFLALGFSSQWETFALYANQPAPDASADPIFGRPLSFFLFTLPVIDLTANWLLTLTVIVFLAAMLLSVADSTARFRGISIALGLLLAAIAVQVIVSRYKLVLEEHGLFTGVNYVGHNVLVPGLWLTTAALIVGAGIAFLNVAAGRIRNLIIAVGIPAATYVISGILVPAYVTTFIVRPNELVRETPYIRNNIQHTRKAYNLDQVEEVPFEPRLTNTRIDVDRHRPTLDNIRLWDWRALQDTLRQRQVIRTYYDFPDVDVDRYTLNGKPVGVMLSARELSLAKLLSGSQNWVNERLIYTHGYGVTMNTVSQFTTEGLPQFILSNMPVESTQPEIQVKRPEIYFGEITNWPVYGKTRQKEFNYSEGEANNYTTYEGTGGIRMGSLLRRIVLASYVNDIAKVPFSDDITADSVLLFRRNIVERVSTVAPFLTLDTDPYLVVGDDGALYWFIDAFTTSANYPNSRALRLGDGRQRLNYIRNSVKAVVDAYNGTVTLYVFDPTDPLINAYQSMFPALFRPASTMPEGLRKHVRYPELFVSIQARMYATYHVENEQVFYNREDIWTLAQQGRGQGGQPTSDAIEPFYILMSFPGESKLEFVAILPFTPVNRNNLIGWLGARSDGDNYGKLRAYHFPKTRFVDGPLQVQARIDQNPQLSSQLTLWNQQGSKVIRGNLLVIPMDDTLLFAEPIYLQAERSPMPELRLVVLATQDRLSYAPTFAETLKALVEGRPGQIETTATTTHTTAAPSPPTTGPPTTGTTDVGVLVQRANQALSDYRRLTADGRLGEAGAKLDDLKRTLEELNRLQLK